MGPGNPWTCRDQTWSLTEATELLSELSPVEAGWASLQLPQGNQRSAQSQYQSRRSGGQAAPHPLLSAGNRSLEVARRENKTAPARPVPNKGERAKRRLFSELGTEPGSAHHSL